jgi:hypothetical protein
LYVDLVPCFYADPGSLLLRGSWIPASTRIWFPVSTRIWFPVSTRIWFPVSTRIWIAVSTRIWFPVSTRIWFPVSTRIWFPDFYAHLDPDFYVDPGSHFLRRLIPGFYTDLLVWFSFYKLERLPGPAVKPGHATRMVVPS